MPMWSPMRSPWGPMRASGAPTAQDLSPNRRTLASYHWRRRAFQVVRASLDQSVCAHHWRRRASRVNARIIGGCLLAHHGPMLTIQMNLRPALNKLVMYVLFLAPPCHTVCKSKIWMATGNGLQIRSLFRPLQSLHADKSRSACLWNCDVIARSRESFDHHCDVSIVTSSFVYSRLKTFFIATARVVKDAADYTGCENDTASCVSTLDHVAAYPASPILGSVDSTNLP